MPDQHIIVCLERQQDSAPLIAWARLFADRLHKGIILLHVCRNAAEREQATRWIASLGLPYIVSPGRWATAIEGLPTAVNGILAIAAADPAAPRTSIVRPARLLRTFATCKTAYLAIPAGLAAPAPGGTINAALTLDHRRESKEKLIWGSYFPRFFGTPLQVLSPLYRDGDLRRRWQNNLQFLNKMYLSLGISHTERSLGRSSLARTPDLMAVGQGGFDLLVSMTTPTRDRDLGDWLAGPPERRLLARAAGALLLFLNQRDDLYVLCD